MAAKSEKPKKPNISKLLRWMAVAGIGLDLAIVLLIGMAAYSYLGVNAPPFGYAKWLLLVTVFIAKRLWASGISVLTDFVKWKQSVDEILEHRRLYPENSSVRTRL